jgi:hypothetical protein
MSFLALLTVLTIFSAIPGLQLFSYGYLLAASGRVARSGRIRDGAPGLGLMGQVLKLTIAALPHVALIYLGIRLATDMYLIDPDSASRHLVLIASRGLAIMISAHLVVGLLRGAKSRYFYQPLANLRWLVGRLRDRTFGRVVYARLSECGAAFHLPLLLWLGGYCFVFSWLWLALPVWLLSHGTDHPVQAWLGGALLTLVAFHLPIMQTRFAMLQGPAAAIDVSATWRSFAAAPLRWLLGGSVALLLPLPLYGLKMYRFPFLLLWILSGLVIVGTYLIRLISGWAQAGCDTRRQPASRIVVWPSTAALLAVAATYAALVFYIQYFAWHGADGIWKQHAFLFPHLF